MSPTWFEPGEDGQPVPAPADYGPSLSNLIGDAVVALGEYAEAMRVVLVHPARDVSEELADATGKAVAALNEYRDRMAQVLVRLGDVAKAQDRVNDAVRGRFESLEGALGMRRWDDPGPATTVRLGPAFVPKVTRDPGFRVAGPDGEVRPKSNRSELEAADWADVDALIERAHQVGPEDAAAFRAELEQRFPSEPATSARFELGWDGLARRKQPAASSGRVVYGARCSWWDSIDKVGTKDGVAGGLPVCPHCGSPLFEVESEAVWLGPALARYEAAGRPGYRAMIEWGRGKCFRAERPGEHPMEALRRAYEAETGTVLTWTAI